ncbi:MerR family transcriptional regulator [Microbacterium sp. 179-I 1D1 NHS]|uniref:transcriptional regulator FtsR n=1 Tax=unclassified Microbacterium TaxID=2609290 RepID=UPI00387A38C2
MSSAAATRGRAAPSGSLSIGQVLARLSPEFPALTASKLRFLEVQGIVTPVRTDSGYRKFSAADVERLRTALTMQRDFGIPLARIREYLEEHGDEASPAPPASIVQTSRRYRRDELITAAGATATLMNEAVSAGLIGPSDSFDERALGILRSLVALNAHGIQPRHVRTIRQSVEREVSLIESAIAPLLRRTDAGSRAQASETAPELARRLEEIRQVFVSAALERLTP